MTETTASALLLFRAGRREPPLHGAFGEQDGFPIGYGFLAGAGIPFITRTVQRAVIGRTTAIGKIRASGSFTRILTPFQ